MSKKSDIRKNRVAKIISKEADLDRWFKEKWVDISKKDKSGKHPPCGREDSDDGKYPKCRPSKRVNSKTPVTSKELSKKEKEKAVRQKRKVEKNNDESAGGGARKPKIAPKVKDKKIKKKSSEFPFDEMKIGQDLFLRRFSSKDSKDFVWHRDKEDRVIRVVSSDGWKIQFEDSIPQPMIPGSEFFIKKNSWHRIISGKNNALLMIKKDAAVFPGAKGLGENPDDKSYIDLDPNEDELFDPQFFKFFDIDVVAISYESKRLGFMDRLSEQSDLSIDKIDIFKDEIEEGDSNVYKFILDCFYTDKEKFYYRAMARALKDKSVMPKTHVKRTIEKYSEVLGKTSPEFLKKLESIDFESDNPLFIMIYESGSGDISIPYLFHDSTHIFRDVHFYDIEDKNLLGESQESIEKNNDEIIATKNAKVKNIKNALDIIDRDQNNSKDELSKIIKRLYLSLNGDQFSTESFKKIISPFGDSATGSVSNVGQLYSIFKNVIGSPIAEFLKNFQNKLNAAFKFSFLNQAAFANSYLNKETHTDNQLFYILDNKDRIINKKRSEIKKLEAERDEEIKKIDQSEDRSIDIEAKKEEVEKKFDQKIELIKSELDKILEYKNIGNESEIFNDYINFIKEILAEAVMEQEEISDSLRIDNNFISDMQFFILSNFMHFKKGSDTYPAVLTEEKSFIGSEYFKKNNEKNKKAIKSWVLYQIKGFEEKSSFIEANKDLLDTLYEKILEEYNNRVLENFRLDRYTDIFSRGLFYGDLIFLEDDFKKYISSAINTAAKNLNVTYNYNDDPLSFKINNMLNYYYEEYSYHLESLFENINNKINEKFLNESQIRDSKLAKDSVELIKAAIDNAKNELNERKENDFLSKLDDKSLGNLSAKLSKNINENIKSIYDMMSVEENIGEQNVDLKSGLTAVEPQTSLEWLEKNLTKKDFLFERLVSATRGHEVSETNPGPRAAKPSNYCYSFVRFDIPNSISEEKYKESIRWQSGDKKI